MFAEEIHLDAVSLHNAHAQAVQVPNREQLALSYLVQAGLTFTRLKQWDSVARCVEAARHAQGSTSGTDSCSLAVQYINVVGHLTEAATHSLTMRKPLKGDHICALCPTLCRMLANASIHKSTWLCVRRAEAEP